MFYHRCSRYVLFFVIVLQTIHSALFSPSLEQCWWTGCQPSTWAVTGCNQYNRTERDVRTCDGGSEYYCCPPVRDDCWWTGCQPSTWAVTGCHQYNRTERDVRACDGGSEYYCCPPVRHDCWWTGCQPNSWAVRGCGTYNRTEADRTPCEDGFKYQCCGGDTAQAQTPAFPDEDCWWSGCQPKTWADRGCPANTVQTRVDGCPDGDLFRCCKSKSPVQAGNDQTDDDDDDDDDVETISGTSFADYVRYLLMKSAGFAVKPDRVRCDQIDVTRSHVYRVRDQAIRVCDLCPHWPQLRYEDVYLAADPWDVWHDVGFPECFGQCFDTVGCVAFSYDRASRKCYAFRSTAGDFAEADRWTTVFMTQPVGALYDWTYSRHTSAAGAAPLSRTREDTFLSCVNGCDARPGCNVVTYSLTNSTCTAYQDAADGHLQRVDLEYGHVTAFRADVLPAATARWRFVETGDGDGALSLKPSAAPDGGGDVASRCRPAGGGGDGNDTSRNSFYSKACLTAPTKGCDQQTGCKTCYYPELADGSEDLSVCPDSDIYFLESFEKRLDDGMGECLSDPDCMGVGLDVERTDKITLANYGRRQYRKSFMLKFPVNRTAGIHKHLKNYEFVANLAVNPIPNAAYAVRTSHQVTFDECVSVYEKSTYKRMSYSADKRKCDLSSEFVQLVETKNVITLFKKPSLLAASLNYVRTPGVRLNPKFSVEQANCKTDCEETCAGICNQPSNDWCAYVSIEFSVDSSKCYFFNTNESSLVLDPSKNSMILVAQSKFNFTLSALNQVNPFNEDENLVIGCFSDTKEQTQTSLTVYDKPSSATQVAVRHRRGIFDKIGKAIKSVANAVVNTVKDTVKGVVDTAKGVVKAVDKVVKGDLNGAKNAITNIPIVKDIKNAVEFGGAVITGDWDKAKTKGLDLLDSSLVDIGLTVIAPGVGKVIGTGLKSIAKGSKTAVKTLKNQSKNLESNLKPKKSNTGNDKKSNSQKRPDDKNDNKKDEIDRCENRRTRATSKKSGKYSCKRAECDAPKGVRFSYTSSFDKCNKKQVSSRCNYECKVGYEEKGPRATCVKKTNQLTVWDPYPECTLYKCADIKFPVVSVKTPKIDSLTSISSNKYITVYVVMYDKSRKIPVWSVALHQSNQFQSKSYNDAKDFGRKSFFRYPCTSLLHHQAVGSDYTKSGYDQGHLTPANIARWSEKASKSTFAFINIAPQEPYINEHPWQKLEFHVECFSTKRRTLVATGVCKDSLGKQIGKNKIDVPKCFWKMICYKDENSIERVVGFVADNSPILPGKLANRENDIFTARSQSEIEKLYDSTLGSPWIKSIDVTAGREVGINPGFDNDGSSSGAIWLPVNVYDCMKAKAVDKYEKDEWENKLKSKKRKTKRDVSTRFSRGCTPSELDEKQELFDLTKKRLAVGGDADDDDSVSEESPSGNVDVAVQNCGKRIIGYYTSWGVKRIKSSIMAKLTHVIYAFLEMRADGTVDLGSPDVAHSVNVEEETSKSRNRLEHLMNLAKFYPHVKIMFAVGGWENSQYFSKVAASSESRVKFIASVVKLIEKYGFDGVDIDWEYPVTGGAVEGVPQDKANYVLLMKDLRNALDVFAADAGRKNKFLISFAGAAGQWTLDPGFDLPELLRYADFVNVMTYDFFGAWSSKWGAYTGPPAPLYFGMPPRFSGKTNVDWTIKYYTCKSKLPHKINMGVPFYGRFWNNVGDSVDGKDPMWRTANAVNGVFQGGYTPWFKIQTDHLSDPQFEQRFHEKSKSPYAWNAATRVFLGYENQKSLEFKVKYASEKNVGGLMIWSVDLDDDDLTLLNTVYNAPLCDKTNPNDVNHKCSPIDEKRWWTSEDGDDMAGLCGRSAPLYKGYYAVCDPDDPGYSCCGPSGYCGSGEKYCDCPTCKNYGNNPKIILEEPIKPTVPVTWYLLNEKEGLRGRCGRKIPKINGVFPTCNPDDENAYCCSNGNYCGKGADFCDCQGCVNFKKTPSYQFGPKKWWTLEDGDKRAGTCGPKADKVDGVYEAECEPNTKFSCCSPNGYCGSGPDYCDCKGCKRF